MMIPLLDLVSLKEGDLINLNKPALSLFHHLQLVRLQAFYKFTSAFTCFSSTYYIHVSSAALSLYSSTLNSSSLCNTHLSSQIRFNHFISPALAVLFFVSLNLKYLQHDRRIIFINKFVTKHFFQRFFLFFLIESRLFPIKKQRYLDSSTNKCLHVEQKSSTKRYRN